MANPELVIFNLNFTPNNTLLKLPEELFESTYPVHIPAHLCIK